MGSLGTDCPSHAQNGIFHEYLPCQFLNVVSPCSACSGDVGAVKTSADKVDEVNGKRPREFQLVLGQPPSDWPSKASPNTLN